MVIAGYCQQPHIEVHFNDPIYKTLLHINHMLLLSFGLSYHLAPLTLKKVIKLSGFYNIIWAHCSLFKSLPFE